MKKIPEALLVLGIGVLGSGVYLKFGLGWALIETGVLVVTLSVLLALGRK